MRQIFTAFPYVEPPVPDIIADRIRANARLLTLEPGDILKMPGELHHFYMVEEGVCGYFVAGTVFGHSRIMSLLPPKRTVADISVSTGRPCNIETRALTKAKAWACPAQFFKDVIFANTAFSELYYRLTVMKHESTVEGMVANFTLPPEQRLKILFLMLCTDVPQPVGAEWRRVPYRLTAQNIGLVVNVTRSNVSRQLNLWREAGLARKVGLDWELHESLFSDIYDWQRDGAIGAAKRLAPMGSDEGGEE